jgi:TPR repeat protein
MDTLQKIREAAEKGEVYAQVVLGTLHSGFGPSWISSHYSKHYKTVVASVVEDHEEGLKWFRRAADQGSSDGQFAIGQMYEHGTNVTPKDPVEAIKWYTMAANNGDGSAGAWAMNALAAMHFDGKGVKRDYVAAAKWYHKLADSAGGGPAQARLGWMYENGKGVLQDTVEAHKWFNLAVENIPLAVATDEKALEKAQQQAKSDRGRVERAMTPAQIKEAWRRYDEWKDGLRAKTGA